ncbi:MAG: hypothetical protein IJ789_05025 [Bacteroidales bacterium]|nr:hypothetical protein [Bacteroidales bacterium]MBR1850720.1 hypothetical protein [Bacteroidales bacterium]
MKKILMLVVAVVSMLVAQAQVVVGLQGGYYTENKTNTFNADYDKTTSWLGGLQLGYQITPKLYVGVMGSYISNTTDFRYEHDSIHIDLRAHSAFVDMWKTVDDHQFLSTRTGWTVAPIVRYEVVRYGNMHLNILLQGDITSLGYTTVTERYVKPFEHNELEDFDAIQDSIGYFSWGVSLRPTLTYEFSKHLSAELSLDVLSVGYVSEDIKYDNGGVRTSEPYKDHISRMYAGLNMMRQALKWENPMLRLGFNYTF